MTRIETILTRARDTLADPEKERWSDDRLLRLLDEAHKDLAKQTKILKGQHEVLPVIGQHTYDLPDNVWLITRAAFNHYDILLTSYDRMDEQARNLVNTARPQRGERDHASNRSSNFDHTTAVWQLAEGGDIAAVIYDNRNLDSIRLYPIPNEEILDESYDFVSDTADYAGGEMLGVVTEVSDYSFTTAYGIVTELYDPKIGIEVGDTYGVTTGIAEVDKSVVLWYIRVPDTITALTDSLETPSMFDVAIKHYIVGHAFRDDLDVRYREMGAESMLLYNRELEVVDETNKTDGTRNATAFTTTYQGAF